MNNNQKDILVGKVSEVIYDQIIGDNDFKMPRDEYDSEARMLVDVLSKRGKNITAGYIADELSIIFTDMFGEKYSKEDLILTSEKIQSLYSSEGHEK